MSGQEEQASQLLFQVWSSIAWGDQTPKNVRSHSPKSFPIQSLSRPISPATRPWNDHHDHHDVPSPPHHSCSICLFFFVLVNTETLAL